MQCNVGHTYKTKTILFIFRTNVQKKEKEIKFFPFVVKMRHNENEK